LDAARDKRRRSQFIKEKNAGFDGLMATAAQLPPEHPETLATADTAPEAVVVRFAGDSGERHAAHRRQFTLSTALRG